MFKDLRRTVGRQMMILLVLAGAVVVFSDQLLRLGLVAGGRYAVGAPVMIGATDFDLRAGTLRLGELEVANPEGFESPFFLRIENCELEMDLPWRGAEPTRIRRLVLQGVSLQVEQSAHGSNAATILGRLRRFTDSEPKTGSFAMDRIELRDATARVVFAPSLGRLGEVEVELQDVALLEDEMGLQAGHGFVLAHRAVQRLVDLTLLAVSRSEAFPISTALEAELRGRLGRIEPLGGGALVPMAHGR